MIDINNPVGADTSTPPQNISATPTPAAAPTTAQPAAAPAKRPMRKSTLWLLIILLIVGAGAGYYYYSGMNESPDMTLTLPLVDSGKNMTGETMMSGENNSNVSGTNVMMTGEMGNISGSTANDAPSFGTGEYANDLQRQSDLQQIGTALFMYKMDNGTYPIRSSYETAMISIMTTIPSDPDSEVRMSFGNRAVTGYEYAPLYQNGIANAGMLLMARMTTPETANRIDADPALSQISDITKADAAKIKQMTCTSITVNDTTEDSLTKCTAKEGSDKLRYIIVQ